VRWIRLLAILLTLASVVRIAASPFVVAFTECVETCPDDGPDGKCSPGCDDCACCARPATPPFRDAKVELLPTVIALAIVEPARLLPPSPEPRKILHVPKHASA
jgi:hypothetical protein